MNPLRKKVWAPKGQTPELRHRTRHHEKVSVIGALEHFTNWMSYTHKNGTSLLHPSR